MTRTSFAARFGPALLRPALLLFVLTFAAVSTLDAQTLRGRVADGASKAGLSGVTVSLLDPDANVLSSVAAEDNGAFTLSVPGPGEYYVKAERQSYSTVFDGIFDFESEQGLMEIVLFMNPRPVILEGIDVRVQREQVRRRLKSQGFYERAASGFGRFIGPEEMEDRVLFTFGDILRGIPGIIYSGENIQFRATGPGQDTCSPNVFIDGARIFDGFALGTLPPTDVEAVEVYRGVAQTPMEWGGLNGSCGTILVWTKGGN